MKYVKNVLEFFGYIFLSLVIAQVVFSVVVNFVMAYGGNSVGGYGQFAQVRAGYTAFNIFPNRENSIVFNNLYFCNPGPPNLTPRVVVPFKWILPFFQVILCLPP